MELDRAKFFAQVRDRLFGGKLTEGQVSGTEAILNEWLARSPDADPRWLAYMLATTKHETAHTMQPIEEYGKGRGYSYGVPDPTTGQTYYGRGYVQLTWLSNYRKMGNLIGVDLVNRPELALDPTIAATIMFEGMEHGLFTGVGLPRYFNETTDDPVNARRIINGTDRAELIAGYHREYLSALKNSEIVTCSQSSAT